MDALVDPEHRTPRGEPLLLLEVRRSEMERDTTPAAVLGLATRRIAESMGEERVLMAPPAAEVAAWLDSQALYMVPVDRHEELAELLDDTNIAASIQGLAARLPSPLFGVSGEAPRRDPLAMQQHRAVRVPVQLERQGVPREDVPLEGLGFDQVGDG